MAAATNGRREQGRRDMDQEEQAGELQISMIGADILITGNIEA